MKPTANLILTYDCNFKCRHCQNFWRANKSHSHKVMTGAEIETFVSKLADYGVPHCVISGGEPFLHFDLMLYAVHCLMKRGLSVSINSNLSLATEDNIKRLRSFGADHILTSLNSHEPDINDYMLYSVGTQEKIERGIKLAVASGIKVSSNMILQRINMSHIYDTGKLLKSLGVKKMLCTRAVPPLTQNTPEGYSLSKDEIRWALDEMLRVKEDFGLQIGTLVSYPLCFLGDLEKYADFVGRGCPSQSGKSFCVYPDGSVGGCGHSDLRYGNIFEAPLDKIFNNMRSWRGSQRYGGCSGCKDIDLCDTGCRMMAHSSCGVYDGRDPLMDGVNQAYKYGGDKTMSSKEKQIRRVLNLFKLTEMGVCTCSDIKMTEDKAVAEIQKICGMSDE